MNFAWCVFLALSALFAGLTLGWLIFRRGSSLQASAPTAALAAEEKRASEEVKISDERLTAAKAAIVGMSHEELRRFINAGVLPRGVRTSARDIAVVARGIEAAPIVDPIDAGGQRPR